MDIEADGLGTTSWMFISLQHQKNGVLLFLKPSLNNKHPTGSTKAISFNIQILLIFYTSGLVLLLSSVLPLTWPPSDTNINCSHTINLTVIKMKNNTAR